MTAAITVNLSALLDSSSGVVAIGDVLIDDASSGAYVKATTANRGTRRAHGLALTAWGSATPGTVQLMTGGIVDASITGLTAGAASWVRTSSAGRCERCTPASGDDLLGKCDADGNLFLDPGVWDSTNYAGGGGGGSFTAGGDLSGSETSQTVEKVKGTTITTAGGALAVGAVLRTTAVGTADWGAVNLADTDAVTGTLPKGNQGAQDMAGDVTGTTAASVVAKVNGTTVTTAGGALATGAVLRVTGVASATWGAVDLADTDAVTGVLPTGNVATTLTGKTLTTATIDADQNTITNIENADIKAGAAIAVAKLAAGANGEVLQTTGGVTVWGAAPGGGSPGGADTQIQRNNGGAFGGVSGVTTDGTGLTALKIADSAGGQYYTFAVSNLVADRTVTLPLLTGNDVFAFEAHTQTLTNKTFALGSNTLTGTSAQFATACSDETGSGSLVFGTAPLFKTTINLNNPADTFKYVITPAAIAADRILNLPLLTGTDTVAVLALAQTLTNKTMDWGSNTMTFTSAQAKTACSDETGSGGALVFATSPTISGATLSGSTLVAALRYNGVTTNASTGTVNNCTLGGNRVITYTNAVGPTVTGFDATGISAGDVIRVYAAAATVAFTNEDAGSTAANRITLAFGTTVSLNQGTFTEFMYLSDGTNSRWRHMGATAI